MGVVDTFEHCNQQVQSAAEMRLAYQILKANTTAATIIDQHGTTSTGLTVFLYA